MINKKRIVNRKKFGEYLIFHRVSLGFDDIRKYLKILKVSYPTYHDLELGKSEFISIKLMYKIQLNGRYDKEEFEKFFK